MAQAAPHSNHNFTYGLGSIMRRLGQYNTESGRARGEQWQISYVNQLITLSDFPKPFPLPVKDGLTGDVKPRSRWSAEAVDYWFAAQLNPAAQAQADASQLQGAATDMDNRAGKLGHLSLVSNENDGAAA